MQSALCFIEFLSTAPLFFKELFVCQTQYCCFMLWEHPNQFTSCPKLKIFVVKAWGNRTSNKRERCAIVNPGSEPQTGSDDDMALFSMTYMISKPNLRQITFVVNDVDRYWASPIKVPNFVGIKPMKGRKMTSSV